MNPNQSYQTKHTQIDSCQDWPITGSLQASWISFSTTFHDGIQQSRTSNMINSLNQIITLYFSVIQFTPLNSNSRFYFNNNNIFINSNHKQLKSWHIKTCEQTTFPYAHLVCTIFNYHLGTPSLTPSSILSHVKCLFYLKLNVYFIPH